MHGIISTVGDGMVIDMLTEQRRVKRQNKRAIKVGGVATLSVGHWMLRLAQFHFRCAYCGRPFETMDHVLPISCGGPTTFYNVVPACEECNKQKGAAVWLPAKL